MNTKGKMYLAAVTLIAIVLAASACGKDSGDADDATGGVAEREPFNLILDFYPNPDHAGIYTGMATEAFEEAGLELSVETPTDPAAPIKQVAAGRADLAISYEPEVALAREQGLDVVAVAAIVNRPLTSMIWLPQSRVRQVSDLAGKTVATAGIPYQDAYLDAILERAGVPRDRVERVSVGLNLMPALMSGRADALLGAFRNIEGVELQRRGRKPTIRPVDELGVPTYNELVLVANATTLEEKGDSIRLFIAALERATATAVADPARATQDILQANDALKPKLTRAWMDATLPLLEQSDARPFGWMNARQWDRFIAWMGDQGLIESRPNADEVMTNRFLPDGVPAEE